MYSNILVPIALDSEDDRVADSISVAKRLASEGARITLLHVVESVPSYAISYISDDILRDTRKMAFFMHGIFQGRKWPFSGWNFFRSKNWRFETPP